ncbi:PucR family transcriptional regulator [Prescottella agglutinans]|uniref:PucR family transcriptional regulator n=1 Tax=Prescottella agglutinans TaxID=1644129 RepID=A0A3S3E8U4_9NOCA|nr:PucR family transcriptional regulator [Prescottella agglutinans]RVW08383.1 PucR family transcriptional regulator [Prescottella agglutinans]
MIRVSALIEAMGGAVLRPVVSGSRDHITDVTLVGGDDTDPGHPGNLVLGLGIRTGAAAAELLRRSARSGASAVVLEAPVAADKDVVDVATELGVGLIELHPQVTWTHLVWLTRSILDHSTALAGSDVRHEPNDYGELFAFADAAAAIVSAPVTIEDAHSRVLAYSERQDTADAARISTIIGRRVPEAIVRHFRSRGVFRHLQESDEPIRVDAGPGGVLPRLVIPVRAGRELLGSIWAVDPGPVPEEQIHELTRTASVVALHLLRLRAQAGAARRMTVDRLRAALLTPDHTIELTLPPGPWRVAALAATAGEEQADYPIELWDSILRRHGWPQPMLTSIEDLPMVVVTAGGAANTAGSWNWLQAVFSELNSGHRGAAALAGAPAQEPAELPRSRSEAAELVVLARRGRLDAPSASFEEAWHEVVLARASAAMVTGPPLSGGPVQALIVHDRERGTEFVTTLAAFLVNYGEPKRAAETLHVHPNTLRYRMKQITDLTGYDLTDPRRRLAVALALTSVSDPRNQPAWHRGTTEASTGTRAGDSSEPSTTQPDSRTPERSGQ